MTRYSVAEEYWEPECSEMYPNEHEYRHCAWCAEIVEAEAATPNEWRQITRDSTRPMCLECRRAQVQKMVRRIANKRTEIPA